MLKMFRFFFGFVRISILGYNPHRFLNLCSKRGIEIWDIDCKSNECIEMNLLVRDFFKLKPIVRKAGMKVVLLSKKGLPFRLQKWKHRKFFLVGFLCCFLLLFIMSGFIWDIELSGGNQLTKEMLLQFLSQQNITYGSQIRKIPIDEAEKALRDAYPYIVWTSFQVEGTRLIVNIKENSQNLETKQVDRREFEASDLVATLNGTVESIITRAGVPRVKTGDEIKKGDVLVSGIVPIINDDETIRNYMPVESDADVYIRTTFQYDDEVAFDYTQKEYTNHKKSTIYMKVFHQSFVTGGPPNYQNYDVKTDLRQAKLMNDFYLPLYFGTIDYQEYEMKKRTYNQQELKDILEQKFVNFCESLKEKGIQILEKDVKIKKNMEKLCLEATITVIVKDGDHFATEIPVTENENTNY